MFWGATGITASTGSSSSSNNNSYNSSRQGPRLITSLRRPTMPTPLHSTTPRPRPHLAGGTSSRGGRDLSFRAAADIRTYTV